MLESYRHFHVQLAWRVQPQVTVPERLSSQGQRNMDAIVIKQNRLPFSEELTAKAILPRQCDKCLLLLMGGKGFSLASGLRNKLPKAQQSSKLKF